MREYLSRYGKPLALYSDKASIFRVNRLGTVNGVGHTQFSRALYELNIDGICANTPAAKGRVERAHLTLQDRLVKELRLAGISSIEAANALMPSFIETYNRKFAKIPRDAHDAHRPVRPEEDLDLIFAWRELRKVSQNLILHYERKLYALRDTAENRRLIGKYVEVFQYPDGRIEIRVAGQALPYSLYKQQRRLGARPARSTDPNWGAKRRSPRRGAASQAAASTRNAPRGVVTGTAGTGARRCLAAVSVRSACRGRRQ
jgi:hypothetical protein